MSELFPILNPRSSHITTEKGGLDSSGIRSLNTIAEEIKEHQKTSNESYLGMGRLLKEAKDQFGKKHGEWLKWLRENVDISICKAQRLMRVAEWLDGNEAPVPHLEFTKMYILSRLTKEDLKTFLEGKHIEDMSKRDLQKAISEHLRERSSKSSTIEAITQQQVNGSTENNLRQRFDKIQNEISELASLVDNDSGAHDAFAADLCELCQSIIQQLSSGDIEEV